MTVKNLYPSFQNPYLIKPTRPMPKEMAVVGSGTIGPDIAYGFRTAFPEMKLYLVDVVVPDMGMFRQLLLQLNRMLFHCFHYIQKSPGVTCK